MSAPIVIEPLTRDAFSPFGNIIEIDTAAGHPINAGTTERFHALATVIATGTNARPILSMARAQAFALPLTVTMLERHPFGSQAFVPVRPARFLVIVAPDKEGAPGRPRAFAAGPGQGINYFPGTWHGVLTALDGVTDFLIADREGDETNLEEHVFATPFVVVEA